jgi:hypothetical protein
MATLDVDKLRAIADSARDVATPIRMIQVTIRTRTWGGGRRGVEPSTDADFVLPRRYRVRQISSKEIASSGGLYNEGDMRIGPITPPYTSGGGGGFTAEQLRPAGATNKEIFVILTGDMTGEYTIKDFNSDRPFSWFLIIGRRETTPT